METRHARPPAGVGWRSPPCIGSREVAVAPYAEAVRYVQETYYLPDGVTRHSTNAFMRLKLGTVLAEQRLHPSIHASLEEAEQEPTD